jgi:hypothetical protein
VDLIDLLRAVEDDTSIRVALRDAAWLERVRLLRDMPQPPSGELIAPVGDSGRVIGALHHRAKWGDDDIELMRQLRETGMPYRQIVEKFDAGRRPSEATVRHVCTGRRRSVTVMGHTLVRRLQQFLPAHPDEFEVVRT